METSRGLAVKVGIFFVIGLILLIWFSLKSEGPGFGKKAYTLYAYFNKTNNLVEGDPVTLAGMDIGKVKALTFDTDKQKIKATLDIQQDYKLKQDSVARIVLKSIMGQKYVDITIGTPGAPLLKNDDTVKTMETQEFEEIVANVGDLTKQAQEMIASLNKNQDRVMHQVSQLIDDNKENVKKTTQAFANASPKIEKISVSVDKITADMADGKGTIGKLIAKDDVYNNVSAISGNLKAITTNVKTGKGTIGKMVNDDALYKSAKSSFSGISTMVNDNKDGIKTIVDGTKKSMPKIEKSVDNVQQISERINKGQGTIGKLVNDPSLFDDTKKAINQVQEAFEENQEQSVLRTFVGVVLGTML